MIDAPTTHHADESGGGKTCQSPSLSTPKFQTPQGAPRCASSHPPAPSCSPHPLHTRSRLRLCTSRGAARCAPSLHHPRFQLKNPPTATGCSHQNKPLSKVGPTPSSPIPHPERNLPTAHSGWRNYEYLAGKTPYSLPQYEDLPEISPLPPKQYEYLPRKPPLPPPNLPLPPPSLQARPPGLTEPQASPGLQRSPNP